MVLLIAIVLGALVGAAVGEGAGALAGALFGWLIVRSVRQQREIEALRQGAGATATRAARLAVPPEGGPRDDAATVAGAADPGTAGRPPTTASTASTPAPMTATAVPLPASAAARVGEGAPPVGDRQSESTTGSSPQTSVQPALSTSAPIAEPAAASAAFADAAPQRPNSGIAAAPPRDVLSPIKAWLFGGNTIVKAGIGILFIGLAFLAKYASEHAHLPVELRLAGIGSVALVLLGFGWRLRLTRARLRAGAARRRDRGPLPDAVRRVPLLRRARGRCRRSC